MHIRIKGSKTDPFRKGRLIHIGIGQHPLCAIHALMTYLMFRGDAPGPLLLFQSSQPLSRFVLTAWALADHGLRQDSQQLLEP